MVGKVGRPSKAETHARTISIVQACETLMYLTKDIKDFCISFDHSRDKVEVLWHEEVYQVDVVEMPKVIDCIKFLNSKELIYVN